MIFKKDRIKEVKAELFDIEEKINTIKRKQKQIEEELENINFCERYKFPIKKIVEYYNKHIKNKKKPKDACRMRNENELDIEPTKDYYQFTLLKDGVIKIDIDFEKMFVSLKEAELMNRLERLRIYYDRKSELQNKLEGLFEKQRELQEKLYKLNSDFNDTSVKYRVIAKEMIKKI